jgi:hypothetical protein
MKHTKLSVALASALILAVGTPFAGAVATMRISDGVTTLTITDDGAGDSFTGLGAVTFVGSIGAWVITVDTGITMPIVGTATRPYMDVLFLATSNLASPGSLTIEFSEVGYGPLDPGLAFHVAIGGTTQGTVTCTTLVDSNNVLFGGVPIVPAQTFSGPAFSCEGSGAALTTHPFSLTKIVTINHGAGQQTTSGDTQVTVPDGGATLALFGISLLGLGALRNKLRKS